MGGLFIGYLVGCVCFLVHCCLVFWFVCFDCLLICEGLLGVWLGFCRLVTSLILSFFLWFFFAWVFDLLRVWLFGSLFGFWLVVFLFFSVVVCLVGCFVGFRLVDSVVCLVCLLVGCWLDERFVGF